MPFGVGGDNNSARNPNNPQSWTIGWLTQLRPTYFAVYPRADVDYRGFGRQLFGTGAPISNIGKANDTWTDSASGKVYKKQIDTWVEVV